MRLVADQLSAARSGRTLFTGVSFALADGDGLLLTGPNGSGKTTLLRVLAGFLAPSAGAVSLEGQEGEPGEHCHFVGHLPQSKAGLSVRDNLDFDARFLGGGQMNRVDTALAELGLAGLEDIRAGYLSAGQRRRLALARLLVANRPVWLLDEPSVSLDQASVDVLARLIAAHRQAGGIVVAATHVPLGLTGTTSLRLGGGS
ncbi:MAG: heme ABC exporter ATP-binding protein CcmA [Hyphomicrobiaceae bacterium]